MNAVSIAPPEDLATSIATESRSETAKETGIYLLAVFLISYAMQGVIFLSGGINSPAFTILAPAAMFAPAIGLLFPLRKFKTRFRSIPWRLPKPTYLLYAACFPAIAAILTIALIASLGLADSRNLRFSGIRVDVVRGIFLLGRGPQSVWYFVINLLVSAILVSAVNGLVSVGEEVGWRGFLQKRLTDRIGLAKGVAFLGLIWAVWHIPIILMGYNYPETPVLGAFVLWPLMCIGISFFLAWLTINSRSIWPAVLGHGSLNAFYGGPVQALVYRHSRLTGELIVIATWGLIALVAFFLIDHGQKART